MAARIPPFVERREGETALQALCSFEVWRLDRDSRACARPLPPLSNEARIGAALADTDPIVAKAPQAAVHDRVSTSGRAIFLSYASQDAEAARRICDALRGAGLEVWFDQSELRGGDAWDASIRKQIKDCALFVPIISANTQVREEGYFRREWNLAAQRTLDMAEGKAFLLPVVIDTTLDANALVPEKFREVQWTHLPEGTPVTAFA